MSMVSPTNDRRSHDSSLPSDWREPLNSRMGQLRVSVVRLLWLRAVALLLIGCVLGIVAVVALDWWLRPSGSVGRWTLSGLLVASLGGVAVWFAAGASRRRISTAAVARQLERLIPSLGDRLSSAVALASGEAETSGLSERAVRQATAELQAARPERTIDHGPALRTVLVASLLVGALIGVCVWRPATASLAARRLLNPSSPVAWPQRHELELAGVPDRVHAGTDVTLFVRDRQGTIPADAEIWIRDAESGRATSLPLRMSGTSGAAEIENVTADFAVRARGGDDDRLPWQTVRVVPPPRIEEYLVHLLPPEYSGRQPQTLVGERFRVLAGTQIRLEATVMPAVVEARLVNLARSGATSATEGPATERPAAERPAAEGSAPSDASSEAEPTRWPVEIDGSGRRIAVGPIALHRDAQFVFRWIDAEGLSGESQQRWSVEVVEDAVPRVAILEPPADVEVTPAGLVDLQMTVEDDLGLAEAWLEIHAVGSEAAQRVAAERYEAGPREQALEARLRIEELFPDAATDGSSRRLAAGDTVELTGVALDTAGQRGESTTRRLRIVSSDVLRQSLAERQRGVIEPLREAAREQIVAAEQTEAARGRLFGDAQQRSAAEDRLQAAEAAQAAAQRRVSEGPEGVIGQLRSMVRTARDNQLDSESLEEVLRDLEAAAEESIEPAAAELENSRQQLADGDEQAAARAMDQAISNQRDAAEALNDIVDALRRDDARRSALEDLRELQAAQTRLSELSRQVSSAADSRSEASRLAQQQRALAREVEAMGERLRQLAESMREQNPEVAEAAAEAAEALQQGTADDQPQGQQPVADSMRAAATEIERGREGRAAQLQTQVSEQLSAAGRELAGENRPAETLQTENETALPQFAAGLETLRSEQAAVVVAMRDGADPSLETTQSQLAERTDALAAAASAPPGFPESLADAAAEMRVAAALLRRSRSQADALDRAESALSRLELIAQSLRSPETPSQPPGDPSQQQDAVPDTQEPQDQPVPLPTLRLVRATQDFLRARTEQIAAEEQTLEQDSGGPAEAAGLRRARLQAAKRGLAEEQQRLVERIERYAQEMAAAGVNQSEEPDAPNEN